MPPSVPGRPRLGPEGESRAATHLASLGLRVAERNFRCRQGEIDLIAWDGPVLVFVEVKTRSGRGCGAPEEAVSATKQRRLRQVALWYLARLGYEPECRFDVVSIMGDEITHFRAAFE